MLPQYWHIRTAEGRVGWLGKPRKPGQLQREERREDKLHEAFSEGEVLGVAQRAGWDAVLLFVDCFDDPCRVRLRGHIGSVDLLRNLLRHRSVPPSVVETLTARGRSGASPHGALGLEEDGDPLVPDHVGTPWSTKRGAAAWEDWAVENTVENREIRRVAAALGLKPDDPRGPSVHRGRGGPPTGRSSWSVGVYASLVPDRVHPCPHNPRSATRADAHP